MDEWQGRAPFGREGNMFVIRFVRMESHQGINPQKSRTVNFFLKLFLSRGVKGD